mgnify:CR=1 FL=1
MKLLRKSEVLFHLNIVEFKENTSLCEKYSTFAFHLNIVEFKVCSREIRDILVFVSSEHSGI